MPCYVLAQVDRVEASLKFERDSVKLGEVIELRMTLVHPNNTEVFFPSRRRDFLPFEWIGSERLPTEKEGNSSTDVVVYQVRTFVLSPSQGVSLPYGYQSETDTLREQVRSNQVQLVEMIDELNDTLSYQIDPTLASLGVEDDSSVWWFWVLGVFALLGLLVWLLRPVVLKLLRRRSLLNEWTQLKKKLQRLPQESEQGHLFDQMSRLWRQWLDPQENWGLLTLTTTELRQRLPLLSHLLERDREVLIEISEATDQVIYAGKDLGLGRIQEMIKQLMPILQQEYKRRDLQVRES